MSYISNLTAAWKSRYEAEPREASAPAVTGSLSPRESDILRLIAEGLSNKEIARDLTIAPETVKSHLKQIFIKLESESGRRPYHVLKIWVWPVLELDAEKHRHGQRS